MTQEQIEFNQKWVAALRSGKYEQGVTYWYDVDSNTYCCLGVANKVSEEDLNDRGVIKPNEVYTTSYIGGELYNTTNKCGLSYDQKRFLATQMNDRGISFEEIADFIEQTYITPFLNSGTPSFH